MCVGQKVIKMDERRKTLQVTNYIVATLLGLLQTVSVGFIYWIGTNVVEMKTQVAGLSDKYALREELTEFRGEVRKTLADHQTEITRIATEQARRTAYFSKRFPDMQR
jgi:hypothetical protein